MFKVSFLLSGENPFRHLGTEAAAIALDAFPGLVGCSLTRALEIGEAPAFSGCLELYFPESTLAMDAGSGGPGQLLAENAEIVSILVGIERVVVRAAGFSGMQKIKGVYPFRRRPGMSVADFQRHWWHVHGPIAALTEEALGYIQVHPVPDYYNWMQTGYDGITEIYWPDAAAAGRAIDSRQMREDQGSDAPNFVDLDSIALFFAVEDWIIDY